jgi:hypothetical protein
LFEPKLGDFNVLIGDGLSQRALAGKSKVCVIAILKVVPLP